MRQQVMIVLAMATMAVVGCTESAPTSPPVATQPVVPPPPPSITKSDWADALASSYVESKRERMDDGTTEFVACFVGAPPKCGLMAFGVRDNFRKLTFFTPVHSKLQELGSTEYLHSYLSIRDCKLPMILLNARYFSKNGWLFLRQVSILVDDSLAIDRTFEHHAVDRDNLSYGVSESATLVATDKETQAIKLVPEAQQVIIRLTGDKTYVNLDKEKIGYFRKDAADVSEIYSAITKAVERKQPVGCD